jgi:hypothetical protein
VTTLVSWISYTSAGRARKVPGALYIVSDSRISWGSSTHRWDAGRKVFATREEPHLFGYCGDVVFPSLVLGQITSAIDQKILFSDEADAETRHELILESIKKSFGRRHNAPDESFWILHAMRKTGWPTPEFALWQISYDARRKVWGNASIPIPSRSGAASARKHAVLWRNSDVGDRSSSIFSAFCDALNSGNDPYSGGPPQIAALFADISPRMLGFIKDGTHYLHGLEIAANKALSRIEWRDDLFQRINPITLKRMAGARRFARPAGI